MTRETSSDTYRWNWHSFWIQISNSMIAFERRNLWKCESQPVVRLLLIAPTDPIFHSQITHFRVLRYCNHRHQRLSLLPHWMAFCHFYRLCELCMECSDSLCTDTLHRWNEKETSNAQNEITWSCNISSKWEKYRWFVDRASASENWSSKKRFRYIIVRRAQRWLTSTANFMLLNWLFITFFCKLAGSIRFGDADYFRKFWYWFGGSITAPSIIVIDFLDYQCILITFW